MRAIAEVSQSEVAVHAENAKPSRVSVPLQPIVQILVVDLASMLRTITVDVIDRKKLVVAFSATRAGWASVCREGLELHGPIP
jgi:hypothetical protein